MQTTNAIEVRRSLGKVLRRLARGGEPILVERNGKPAAVLISLLEFRQRFADVDAAEDRQRLIEEVLAMRKRAKGAKRSAVEEVRRIRGPLP
jgi:prevent-host-death family protein